MIPRRLLCAILATMSLAMLAASPTVAQTYPTKPIRLIVPYPAGGPTDLMGRMIAEGLRLNLGQPVVVENRAGASGNLGTDFVAKSAPDGYTILLSGAAALAVNVSLFANLPYDPRRDFTPLTKVVAKLIFRASAATTARSPGTPSAPQATADRR